MKIDLDYYLHKKVLFSYCVFMNTCSTMTNVVMQISDISYLLSYYRYKIKLI